MVLAAALVLLPSAAQSQGKAPAKDALLYFIWPQNSAHHHLLIDVNEPLDVNEPIPQDKNHLHFGAGQTEARLELPPGKHTLQLVLGDAKHYPFNPPLVSEKIKVTIKGSPATA